MLHFVIGDIHGCIDELLLLEQKILRVAKKNNKKIKIISVGDLVDRGPNSKAVVEHFLQGEKSGTHLAIMGNHESNFLCYLRDEHSVWFRKNHLKLVKYFYSPIEQHKVSRLNRGFTPKELLILMKGFWLAQGGIETLESYGVDHNKPSYKNLPVEHVKYLNKLSLYFETSKFIVTHALPKKSDFATIKKYESGKQKLNIEVKNACNDIYWNRDRKNLVNSAGKILISGHSPSKVPHRSLKGRVVQIDTHCFKGGKLTAFCPELDRFYSIKAKRKYFGR